MEQNHPPKWQGKAVAQIKAAGPSQIWPLLQDFCSLHRWLPTINVCRLAGGVDGQVGCLRYCASTAAAPGGGEGEGAVVAWAIERLVAIDPEERTLTYVLGDNSLGMGDYTATMSVLPGTGEGCEIEWRFAADPAEGWTQEGLLSYIESGLQGMAKRMEEHFLGISASPP